MSVTTIRAQRWCSCTFLPELGGCAGRVPRCRRLAPCTPGPGSSVPGPLGHASEGYLLRLILHQHSLPVGGPAEPGRDDYHRRSRGTVDVGSQRIAVSSRLTRE